jgi:hypothetical protein
LRLVSLTSAPADQKDEADNLEAMQTTLAMPVLAIGAD